MVLLFSIHFAMNDFDERIHSTVRIDFVFVSEGLTRVVCSSQGFTLERAAVQALPRNAPNRCEPSSLCGTISIGELPLGVLRGTSHDRNGVIWNNPSLTRAVVLF